MNIKTLLAMIDITMTAIPDAEIVGVSRKFNSYRGYYEHLAMAQSEGRRMSLVAFYNVLADQIGKVYHGYKGGEYTMTEDTLLFVAEYGRTGYQVVGLLYNAWYNEYTLQTNDID